MSHHASGPNFGFPRGDARLDMTDLYAFTKPGDTAQSIIVLNVHPSFRLDSLEPTTREPFTPGALYEFKIDTDGDAVADLSYSVKFAPSGDGKQTATVRNVQGERAAGVGDDGEVLVEEAPVSFGREALVTKAGDYRFFFGSRSDPFFFDVNGNFNHMQFTGDDFFKDKNVCSIAIELPNSELTASSLGIWCRVLVKDRERWIQVERGGRPMQAVFLVGEKREAYLSESQRMMIASLASSHTNWNTQAAIPRRTRQLSPESCCQTFFRMTRMSRCGFRTMAGNSPTMLSMSSCLSTQTAR